MRNFFLFLLLASVPFVGLAQASNEYQLSIRNGMLLNKMDVMTSDGSKGHIKNTFTQGVLFNYTRASKSGILIFGEVGVNYERYKLDIRDYPFEENFYLRPSSLNSDYVQNKTIYYPQINLGVGYRFNMVKKLKPEIRVGQAMSFPLGYKVISLRPTATSRLSGWDDYVLTTYGNYGKVGSSIVADILTNVYLGCEVPHKVKMLGRLSVGVNIQRKTMNTALTSYRLNYIDALGTTTYTERFDSRRLATTLQINIGL